MQKKDPNLPHFEDFILFFFQIARFLMITSKKVAKNIEGFCILLSYFHI